MYLPEYRILDELYQSPNSIVFRAQRRDNDLPVVLKMSPDGDTSAATLSRFKRESELLAALDVPGVVRHYSLEHHGERLFIVLEDFGGESLHRLLAGQRFELAEVLEIATELAGIIGRIHAEDIVHKDVTPANIVYNREPRTIKLIDFNSATRLRAEDALHGRQDGVKGTLAYLAPEQTGRMNRPVDHRADLYSFGAVLYELVTGRRFCDSRDPLEMVHIHLAVTPTPPHVVDDRVPKAVSDIVMKLLSKAPEDRYQSGLGVKADLEQALQQLDTSGEIVSFELATRDAAPHFEVPQRLYGRERELTLLRDVIARVTAHRTTEILLLGGYSGIGKTALANQLHLDVIEARGYFISGKFDQLRRATPYSALALAFEGLVEQLLIESDDELTRWRAALSEALGPNGQVIVDLIPNLELIIGPQPPAQELGGTASHNRLKVVFRDFIRVFCGADRPLVVFLDDMQWADSATLDLLESITTDNAGRAALFIEAYRINEVSDSHPFMLSVEQLERQGLHIESCVLEPIASDAVTQLVADTLPGAGEVVPELARLVRDKTGGNPFFIRQFLAMLHNDGLVTFDAAAGGFVVDIAGVRAQSSTDNVIDLLARKLHRLPADTYEALRMASAIGNRFDLDDLAVVCERSPEAVSQSLTPAIDASLITPTNAAGLQERALASSQAFQRYRFAHDRIQQAAHEAIPEDDRARVHLTIGRLLRDNEQHRHATIFDVVGHLNVGASLLADPDERLDLARLNMAAGAAAKRAAAHDIAAQYYRTAAEIFGDSGWEEHYQDCYDSHAEWAACVSFTSRYERAFDVIARVLPWTRSDYERARLLVLKAAIYTSMNELPMALETGVETAALLGLSLPTEPTQVIAELQQETSRILALIAERPVERFVDLPHCQDPTYILLVDLLRRCAPAAYQNNPALFGLISCHMVTLSLEHGNCPASCFGYGTFGATLTATLGDHDNAIRFGKLGVDLSQLLGSEHACAALFPYAGLISPWRRPLDEGLDCFVSGIRYGLETGDLQVAGYHAGYRLIVLLAAGRPLPQLDEELVERKRLLESLADVPNLLTIEPLHQVVRSLRGQLPRHLSLDGDDDDDDRILERIIASGNTSTLCYFHFGRLVHRLFTRQFEDALALVEALEDNAAYYAGTYLIADSVFLSFLVRAALMQSGALSQPNEHQARMDAARAQMAKWAQECPDNFRHLYLIMAAEQARMNGEVFPAMELFEQAIVHARSQNSPRNEALAQELVGRMWVDRGEPELGRLYLRRARDTYRAWGASAKLAQLQAEFPDLAAREVVQPQEDTWSSSHSGDSQSLDRDAIAKASQAIASQLQLDQLLKTLMRIMLAHAGAEVGAVLLASGDELRVEASASVHDGDALEVRRSIPLAEATGLSRGIVNHVARRRETVVLDDAASERQYMNDPHVRTTRPKSVLCMPIVYRGQLKVVLYLENNLAAGVFTEARVEALELLAAQFAVAVDNAMLFAKQEEQARELLRYQDHLEELVKTRTLELMGAQDQLVTLSRQAGMAEIATGILHNLGNALNSIVVSVQLMHDRVNDLELKGFEQVTALLMDYADDTFMSEDPRGKKVGQYLATVPRVLADTRRALLAENQHLHDSVQRIRDIVAQQRAYAAPVAVIQTCSPKGLIDEAVRLTALAHGDDGVELSSHCDDMPDVQVDRYGVIQILVTLLSNAKDAVTEATSEPGVASVRIDGEWDRGDRVVFRVTDNGVGITSENLHNVFAHGFTTKKGAHGFGLHNACNAAKSMGGELTCHSDGPGRGAVFTLELPMTTKPPAALRQTTER
ncbi:trifunctional serine/threonine-protein kinase/ATP-binding protein/sensor histidine kinase [Haliangium sp.]|uniref:trifunctional serine/threonine-protein kinase/ATP-binding protein/sensor histidine kinase n=1 Tax=Haliangium sp. TaxID=2663208 RepID=UPI003D0E6D9A